jgi:RAB protein geranylgeranyltransferase component A
VAIGSLKATLVADRTSFNADRLSSLTATQLSTWLQPPAEFLPKGEAKDRVWVIPLVEERARLLREVGRALATHFDGTPSVCLLLFP